MIKRFIQDIRELNGSTTFTLRFTIFSYMIGCIPGWGGLQCERIGDVCRVRGMVVQFTDFGLTLYARENLVPLFFAM